MSKGVAARAQQDDTVEAPASAMRRSSVTLSRHRLDPPEPFLPAERSHGQELLGAIARLVPELAFAARGVGTANACLDIATRAIPCRAAILRHGNTARGQDLIVAGRGEAHDMIMVRHRGRGTMLQGQVLAMRVVFGGAHLGTIELADPLDDEPFDCDDYEAIQLLADHYAPHVVMGGLVTDAAEIARFTLEERTWRTLKTRSPRWR